MVTDAHILIIGVAVAVRLITYGVNAINNAGYFIVHSLPSRTDMHPEVPLVQPWQTLLPPSLHYLGGFVLGVVVPFSVDVQHGIWTQLTVETAVPITYHHKMFDVLTAFSLNVVPKVRNIEKWNGQDVLEVPQPDLLEATDLMPWNAQVLAEQDAELRLHVVGVHLQGWSSQFISHFVLYLIACSLV